MLFNMALLSATSMALSALAADTPAGKGPEDDSASSIATWKFASAECKNTSAGADMIQSDVDELLEAFKSADDQTYTVPSGGSTNNTQIFFCNSVALILGNSADSEADIKLSDFYVSFDAPSSSLWWSC